MQRIYTRLTVADLRKVIAAYPDLPDDAPVLIDFQTEYDGMEVEKQGAATWCMAMPTAAIPHLRIDATEELR